MKIIPAAILMLLSSLIVFGQQKLPVQVRVIPGEFVSEENVNEVNAKLMTSISKNKGIVGTEFAPLTLVMVVGETMEKVDIAGTGDNAVQLSSIVHYAYGDFLLNQVVSNGTFTVNFSGKTREEAGNRFADSLVAASQTVVAQTASFEQQFVKLYETQCELAQEGIGMMSERGLTIVALKEIMNIGYQNNCSEQLQQMIPEQVNNYLYQMSNNHTYQLKNAISEQDKASAKEMYTLLSKNIMGDKAILNNKSAVKGLGIEADKIITANKKYIFNPSEVAPDQWAEKIKFLEDTFEEKDFMLVLDYERELLLQWFDQ